jgi:hypothetical protein
MSSAEDAAHAHARSLIANDYGTFVRSMTPDAFAQAMEIGGNSWTITSYDLTSLGDEGGEQLFEIEYHTDIDSRRLRYRFRDIEGSWKVVAMERA